MNRPRLFQILQPYYIQPFKNSIADYPKQTDVARQDADHLIGVLVYPCLQKETCY